MPINVKRNSHTKPIDAPGGVNQGFSRVVYQVDTELLVKIDPKTPAIWHMTKLKTSFLRSPGLIFFITTSPLFSLLDSL
jgi:hypothetical protein